MCKSLRFCCTQEQIRGVRISDRKWSLYQSSVKENIASDDLTVPQFLTYLMRQYLFIKALNKAEKL